MLSVRMAVAWSIVASIILSAGPAWPGWVIDEGTASGRRQTLIQGNRIKVKVYWQGAGAYAVITDLNAQTVTQVDYAGRRYATGTVQEWFEFLREASPMLGAAREAMKGHQCRDPELRKVGQQMTIAGYAATRYDVFINGALDHELWIAPDVTAWRELAERDLQRFDVEFNKHGSCLFGQHPLGVYASWRSSHDGYPLKYVARRGVLAAVEVTKAENRAIPAEEFQPPAGFQRKTFRQD